MRQHENHGGELSGLVTLTFDLLTLKVVSESRVTYVGYLYANFGLPRLLCSRLRPGVIIIIMIIQTFVKRTLSASELNLRRRNTIDRQTDRQTSDSINA